MLSQSNESGPHPPHPSARHSPSCTQGLLMNTSACHLKLGAAGPALAAAVAAGAIDPSQVSCVCVCVCECE